MRGAPGGHRDLLVGEITWIQFSVEIVLSFDPDETVTFGDDSHVNRTADRLRLHRHSPSQSSHFDKSLSQLSKLRFRHIVYNVGDLLSFLLSCLVYDFFKKIIYGFIRRLNGMLLRLVAFFCP